MSSNDIPVTDFNQTPIARQWVGKRSSWIAQGAEDVPSEGTPDVGCGVQAEIPLAIFRDTDCIWPSQISATEPFSPEWTVCNVGLTGELWLGVETAPQTV